MRKSKKLLAILTLMCFMFTMMPAAVWAEDEQMNFSDVKISMHSAKTDEGNSGKETSQHIEFTITRTTTKSSQ